MSTPSAIPVSAGLWRGMVEFKQDFAPTRLAGQLLWPVVTLAAMYYYKGHQAGGVSLGSMMYPSVLGMFTIFGMQLMVQYLAADREDGTLLRARSTPGGVVAYLVGKVTLCSLTLVTYLAIIAIPGALLLHGLAPLTLHRALTLLWVLALGMAASQALGAVVGALVPTVRAAGYVSLLLMGLIAVSGVFYPITALPGWLQAVGQASPIYWVGHGMRAALLPEAYAAVEVGGSWRLAVTAVALLLWALLGAALAPTVLRAMTRKESGTRLNARQQRALQRQI